MRFEVSIPSFCGYPWGIRFACAQTTCKSEGAPSAGPRFPLWVCCAAVPVGNAREELVGEENSLASIS